MKRFYFTVLAGLLGYLSTAQSSQSFEVAMQMNYDSISNLNQGFFELELTDSTDVSHIEVNLGTENGLSDLATYIYTFDSTPGSGYSYSRDGNKIKLGVPGFPISTTYFGRIRLKDISGSWSPYAYFIAN